MSLLASAVNGLFAALVTGGIALFIRFNQRRRRRPKLDDAWRTQADELDKRLSAQFQGEIKYLKGQLAARETDVAKERAENARLQRLLGRKGSDD